MVARDLVERGHRRRAFLGLAWPLERYSGFPTPDVRRLEGFANFRVMLVSASPISMSSSGTITDATPISTRSARSRRAPTAIFVNSDIGAADILPLVAEQGLRAPEDAAIVAFDDADSADYLGLTTVRQHQNEPGAGGRTAARTHCRSCIVYTQTRSSTLT